MYVSFLLDYKFFEIRDWSVLLTTVFQQPAQCLEHSKYSVFIERMPSVKAISVYAPQAHFLIPLSTVNKKKVIFKVSKHSRITKFLHVFQESKNYLKVHLIVLPW